jgi:Zn-dependent M28 family amino/carboxypeptidase
VVAFDEEEIGLVGSRAYVSSLRSRGELAQLIGAINLEMLAYQSRDDGAFHVIDCEENESDRLAQVFRQIAAADGELGLRPERACTNRSDHASFWRAGIPAVVVSENFFGGDGNPCYHRSCDQFNRINISYLTRMTSLVARAVATLTSR